MAINPEDNAVPGQKIPLHYHFNMLRDTARMQAFKEALDKKVPAGGKVLELGGGTGVLSFFAASRASKVWCVEREPELVEAARYFQTLNPQSAKVEIVAGDAFEYLPPEPVDVVVCEMIHVALLREKQVQAISCFKERYLRKFGSLPLFIPEAAFLAVQPVQQSFDFAGFQAPAPYFFDPLAEQKDTVGLAQPFVYYMLVYAKELPSRFACDTELTIQTPGTLNALRFITKNVVGILVNENRAVEWFSQYLVAPVPAPFKVQAGDKVQVRFAYDAGARLESLTKALEVTPVGESFISL
ncbi:MAG: methyltransferase domain-containing protein [Planctomycetota bacterium]